MEYLTELQKFALHGTMACIGFVGALVWFYAREWWVEKKYWEEFEDEKQKTKN